MTTAVIEYAEVFVVGPDVERYRLAADMGEVFETLTLLRLQTRCGLEGFAGITTYSEHCFDLALGEALRPLLPELPGLAIEDTEAAWQHLSRRYNSMSPRPQSAIDIALWDLKAKAAGLPLYRLLGAEHDKMRAYASTPLLDSPQHYIDFIHSLLEQGFDTVKLHVWCELERDLELLEAIDQTFGAKLAIMVDLEERYDVADALVLAKRLESMHCIWLEAPLPDTDLRAYAWLRQQTSIRILPAGNSLLTPELMALGIEQNAWDALRTDCTYAGGFTQGLKIAALARSHNLPLELQSWGYTPTQAANLHLMLASGNAEYFEQAVPLPSHEACCLTPIRPRNGVVQAPTGPGLGINIDWSRVKREALLHYHSDY